MIRNLGILAHVDAGKTTVTENMLFLSGAIRSVGNVDKGTSLSDRLEVERRRGISVRATTLSFSWKDVQINLIDTPGHVDFAAEVERSLRILDCAILVLSAVEGIQSHTETIWEALEALGIPVILFVNKLDRVGADVPAVVTDMQRRFSTDIVAVNQAVAAGTRDASVMELDEDGLQALVEVVAAKDDRLLERYMDEESLSFQDLSPTMADCVPRRELFPVFCGVAKSGIGVEALLDGVLTYFDDAMEPLDAAPSGVVFRLDHDAKLGRIAGVRQYAGRLENRDTIHNTTASREEKITQIKAFNGAV